LTQTKSTSRPVAQKAAPRLGEASHGLQALASYAPDALEGDAELSAIAEFAAHLCEADIAAVTLVGETSDRFLAHHGSTRREIAREQAFCPHAMEGRETMVVPDVTADARFADYPTVKGPPHIRFYAGQPLITPEGVAVGTLSVLGSTPRPDGLSELQREGLAVLADAVMLRLRAHRKKLEVEREIEAREAQFRTLADSIPAIAWAADGQGNFEYFNKKMVEFTGDPDDKDGKSFHPDDWEKASKLWQRCLKTGEIYEIEHRLCRHDGEYRWMMSRAVPVRDENGTIIRWFGTAVDIHDIYAASEARELLSRELSHRIKNIFAVVAGLVSLTARKHPEFRDYADELTGIIRALGRAHDFVRPVDGAVRDNLHGLLEELFAPYGDRVRISGADFAIHARAATPLALVFHELATNAAKYGALASEQGLVELKVKERKDELVLLWRERGGKAPKKKPKDGFGSRLVEMSVTGQLDGTWERRFEPAGLVVELTVPKRAIAA
jgi:PAS domain S-box-containing protein